MTTKVEIQDTSINDNDVAIKVNDDKDTDKEEKAPRSNYGKPGTLCYGESVSFFAS